MFKYRIIIILLITAFIGTAAYCQNNADSHQKRTISGSVTSKDFVGNIISLTSGQGEVSFTIPGNAVITRQTRNVGLMDIKRGDSITIQYYIDSPGQNVVVSIVDDNPVLNGY